MATYNPDTGAETEYPVNPDAIVQVLSSKSAFNTGMLNPNLLFMTQIGQDRVVAAYRKPQLTAIWLEGLDNPLRIPMPGLVMFRMTRNHQNPNYRIFACKRRPTSMNHKLHVCVLPNTSNTGVCWGTVARPTPDAIATNDFKEDWAQYLGSRFGNHSTPGKSKKYPKDIRELYLKLDEEKARTYPRADLVPANLTLTAVLKAMLRHDTY